MNHWIPFTEEEVGALDYYLVALKAAMKGLGAKIEPKVYEYGFLKK